MTAKALGQRLDLGGCCAFCNRKFDTDPEGDRRQDTKNTELAHPSADQLEDFGFHAIETNSDSGHVVSREGEPRQTRRLLRANAVPRFTIA